MVKSDFHNIKNPTVEQVDKEIDTMLDDVRAILDAVGVLWNWADRDHSYHAYELNVAMSAVYHLVDRAKEVLEDLANQVLEEVAEGMDEE